jgi:hypothetical protein
MYDITRLRVNGLLPVNSVFNLSFQFVVIHLFSRPHYGPGVDSASNRNEYQEYSLG